MSPRCRTKRSTWLVSGCAAIVLPFPSCRAGESTGPKVTARTEWPAPMGDSSPTCADVADLRVCWDALASGGHSTVVPRQVPPVAPSPLGWLCSGSGAARRCTDRARDAGLFRCEGARCEQRHPRLPDDGEWECADLGGAVLCRGGERPAGTPPGGASPGYVCGDRAGASPTERVCVDLSPDVPEGTPRGFRCRFESRNGLTRVCERDASAHGMTDACDAAHPCISGLSCVRSRCVPREPAPRCWLDRDCDNSVCRFGSCVTGVP